METVEKYKGFEIVETDWTTEVRTGFDSSEVRPVYIIKGLKERPSSPFLTTVEDCREYVDERMADMDEARQTGAATFTGTLRPKGSSIAITVPATIVEAMGWGIGDVVDVTIRKRRRRSGRRGASSAAASVGASPVAVGRGGTELMTLLSSPADGRGER